MISLRFCTIAGSQLDDKGTDGEAIKTRDSRDPVRDENALRFSTIALSLARSRE